jgi:1,4-alpha-glucan branching enzyme
VLRVPFEFHSSSAREVFLAGTFNDWAPRSTAFRKQGEDLWTTEILLAPGDYEYRLVVDDAWTDDPNAVRSVPNPFGGLNSIVEVRPRTAVETRASAPAPASAPV